MSFPRAVILFLALLPGAAFAAELGSVRISLIKGDVQIYTRQTTNNNQGAFDTANSQTGASVTATPARSPRQGARRSATPARSSRQGASR